jgi:O-Antigen ligase
VKWLVVLFVIAMILKDVKFIGDPYWLRGIAQVTLLFIGLHLIASRANILVLKKNIIVFIYILVLLVSVSFSPFKTYSLLQVASLFSPIVFFMGLTLLPYKNQVAIQHYMTTAILYGYLMCAVVSLVIYKISPSLVLEIIMRNEIRFTGVFSEPGIMGLISGLIIGIALFRKTPLVVKIGIVAIGLTCLYLSLSRTFLISLIISSLISSWMYFPKYRKWCLLFIGILTLLIIGISTQKLFSSKSEQKSIENISRSDSLNNLSGRTYIWDTVIKERNLKPFVGEGFAMGGVILLKEQMHSYVEVDSRAIGRVTMHSGYIQALADLGYVGLLVYCLVIVFGIYSVIKNDKNRNNVLILFGLIYLSIANITESVIYTAATFPSIYFWYLAISSAYLPKRMIKETRHVV